MSILSLRSFTVALAVLAMLAVQAPASPAAVGSDVLDATLPNGLRVVIVRNTLAPVVSTVMTYLVGSRDDPAGVPGMAHAQEHMMFRGTKHLSTSELGTVATALGGSFNAATTDTTTEYQFTVPAADLDAVLRIESDRMRDVLDAQSQWQNERGAIEQEVLRDQSSPGNDFFSEVHRIMWKGTPYGHEGVGTRAAFDRLTGPEIKAFHNTWYAPNNAVLVIAGDVDPRTALEHIRTRFDNIPKRAVPAHAVAHLEPLNAVQLDQPTTLVYPLALVALRLPGLNSPDFLASFVLQGILNSERGPLRALVDSGEALDSSWVSMPYVPEAQVGFATAALSPGSDPRKSAARLEGILTAYAQHGVPAELFASTKHQLIAGQELSRNSIEALASDWSTTIAVDREPSIAREETLIGAVTLADVNRVARRYLDMHHAVIGALTPSYNASQRAAAGPPTQGAEKPLDAQPPVTHLPEWASRLVTHISAPARAASPVRTKLANGITLVVQPESISDSVFVYGRVKTNAALQEPQGKEGVSAVFGAMFEYGTQKHDRLAFQREADDADTQVSAGYGFAMQTTSKSFDRGMTLLAENELEPRLDLATFSLARRRALEELATSLNSTGTLAERRTAAYLLPAHDPQLREPTLAGMQALTLGDIKAYDTTTMRPDLTTIVVIGNVSVSAARAAVERDFGEWRAVGAPPALDLPPLPLNPPGEVKITLPIAQDSVALSQIVPLAHADPQIYPLMLGNAILGGGSLGPEQSRLFRDLRQNAGLVYSVGSQISPLRSRYELSIEFASRPENEARIATLIDGEIERMKSEPVGAFELSLAKASIVRQSVIGDASISAIGRTLLNAASSGEPLDQTHADIQHYLDVDAKAIQAAFAANIKPQNFVRLVQGP